MLNASCTSVSVPFMFVQGVTISNDGATIMKLLEIVHPAAKTLVDISLSQDAEVSLAVLWTYAAAPCPASILSGHMSTCHL